MKQYNINVLVCVFLVLGFFSCTNQKTWEELTKEFTLTYHQHRFSEAEEVARERLEVAEIEKIDQKEKNIRIATALIDLGFALFSQEKYEEALEIFQRELSLAKEVFGEPNADVASALGRVGSCYYKLERFPLALPSAQQSFNMFKKIVPEYIPLTEVPGYISTILLLGNIYIETDQFAEAEPYFIKLVPFIDSLSVISDQVVINNVIAATMGLAAVYINTPATAERYSQANTLLVKAGLFCSKDPNKYLYALTDGMDISAQLYEKMGEYLQAESMYLNALKLMRQAEKDNNLKTAYLMSKLGRLYTDMKQYGKADSLLQESLRRYRQLEAGNSLQAGTILHNIGANYMAVGEYSKAEQSLQEAIEIYTKAMGESYPKVILYLEGLETMYYKWGKEEQALATRERINKIRGLQKSI